MRVVIAGGSGFLGHRLIAASIAAGDDVTVLSRHPETSRRAVQLGVTVRRWNPPSADRDLEDALRGADAVVNLAGVPIGGRPWTPGHKRAILTSRLDATNALVAALGRLSASDRPNVLVNASGIDIYGDRPDAELTEGALPGDSFLAGVVLAWERAASAA